MAPRLMTHDWLNSPRKLRAVFIAIMLLLGSSLGLLAWRMLLQDDLLASQRLAEQRETAADLVVAALEKRLSRLEQDLGRGFASLPTLPPTAPSTLRFRRIPFVRGRNIG